MRRARSALRLLSAQARACVGLAIARDPPLVGVAARRVVGAPREEESEVGGVAATIFRPSRGTGPWPAAILYPGVTRQGRRHAAFVGLGRALAGAGFLAVVAEPDGLAIGELTGKTTAQALAAAEAVAARADVVGGRIALMGVSGGATLALCTAASPALSRGVASVLALAPVCDLAEALRFVTTGFRRQNGTLVPVSTRGFFKLVSARSVVSSLSPGTDRDAVLERLRALPDYGDDPLEELDQLATEVSDSGVCATLELFVNRDPERFDGLLEALPHEARKSLASLSAVRGAGGIQAPVELVVAKEDKYIPLADALAFASVCSTARLTVLDSLEHAVPRLALGDARDLVRLNGALVRVLAASYSR
jgi:pimeloyl-ACP methyl ester carboxylesterase